MAEQKECVCGGALQTVTKTRRARLWGWGTYTLPNGKRDRTRISLTDEFTRCEKCGDEFYTTNQMDRSQLAAVRASWQIMIRRLGYPGASRKRRKLRRQASPKSVTKTEER